MLVLQLSTKCEIRGADREKSETFKTILDLDEFKSVCVCVLCVESSPLQSFLALRILHLFSWCIPIALLFIVVLLLFADDELLWRPAQLSALHLSVCGLHHDGWQAVL